MSTETAVSLHRLAVVEHNIPENGWALREVEKMVVKCSFINFVLSVLQFDVVLCCGKDKYCNQVSRVGYETENPRQFLWAKEMHLPTQAVIDCQSVQLSRKVATRSSGLEMYNGSSSSLLGAAGIIHMYFLSQSVYFLLFHWSANSMLSELSMGSFIYKRQLLFFLFSPLCEKSVFPSYQGCLLSATTD